MNVLVTYTKKQLQNATSKINLTPYLDILFSFRGGILKLGVFGWNNQKMNHSMYYQMYGLGHPRFSTEPYSSIFDFRLDFRANFAPILGLISAMTNTHLLHKTLVFMVFIPVLVGLHQPRVLIEMKLKISAAMKSWSRS